MPAFPVCYRRALISHMFDVTFEGSCSVTVPHFLNNFSWALTRLRDLEKGNKSMVLYSPESIDDRMARLCCIPRQWGLRLALLRRPRLSGALERITYTTYCPQSW
jgi:hypothetical protein